MRTSLCVCVYLPTWRCVCVCGCVSSFTLWKLQCQLRGFAVPALDFKFSARRTLSYVSIVPLDVSVRVCVCECECVFCRLTERHVTRPAYKRNSYFPRDCNSLICSRGLRQITYVTAQTCIRVCAQCTLYSVHTCLFVCVCVHAGTHFNDKSAVSTMASSTYGSSTVSYMQKNRGCLPLFKARHHF